MIVLRKIFIYLFFIFLQIKFIPLLSIEGITFSAILLLLLNDGLTSEEPIPTTIFGFFAGLLLDVISGGIIGITSLTFSITAFIIATASRNHEKMSLTRINTYISLLILFHSVIFYLIKPVGATFTDKMIYQALPFFIYTAAIQIIYTFLFPIRKKRKVL